MSVWLWVIVAFLAGGLVGAGITTLLKRGSDVEQRMRRLRREYEQYQAEVARHFSQTGDLLSRLRTGFDQLYNEVEERATALVAEEALQRRLNYLDNTTAAHPGGRERPAAQRPLGDDRAATPGFGAEPPSGAAGSPPEGAAGTRRDRPDAPDDGTPEEPDDGGDNRP